MRDLFPNAGHVAVREFWTRVHNRAFVISTIILAVLSSGVVLAPTVLRALGVDQATHVSIWVDPSADDLAEDPIVLVETLLTLSQGQGPVDPSSSPDEEPDAGETAALVIEADDPDAAADQVRAGELDGLLTISRGSRGELAFEYLSDASLTSETTLVMSEAARQLSVQDRLERAGVAPEDRGQILAPPAFQTVRADPDADPEEAFSGGGLLIAWALVVLTFMAILTYGNWVAQSVAEEKSGRVMELLITAATPRQLLTGKVLGTCGAGLTQYAAVIAAVLISFVASGPLERSLGLESGAGFLPLPPLTVVDVAVFAIFFLGGFILYCTLYAAAGSMVSRMEDVQQAAGPLLVLAMAGYFAATFAINAPDTDWVAGLSLVPFFSPYLIPARMVLTSSVTAGEIAIALLLLAAAILAALWIAARIYAAGVLLYGQRPGLRQVLRAARVAR